MLPHDPACSAAWRWTLKENDCHKNYAECTHVGGSKHECVSWCVCHPGETANGSKKSTNIAGCSSSPRMKGSTCSDSKCTKPCLHGDDGATWCGLIRLCVSHWPRWLQLRAGHGRRLGVAVHERWHLHSFQHHDAARGLVRLHDAPGYAGIIYETHTDERASSPCLLARTRACTYGYKGHPHRHALHRARRVRVQPVPQRGYVLWPRLLEQLCVCTWLERRQL